jgi:NAD(P)H-hydrate epimerase
MRLPQQIAKRKLTTHKGDYGHLLIVGGSEGLSGAVCLVAESALRVGAGLVTVGIPKSLNTIFEIKLTEAMSLPLEETKFKTLSGQAFDRIKEFTKKIDALALGPGASRNSSTQRLILKLIKEIDKPLVVDADGINALAGNLRVLKKRKADDLILTPHLGEFSRLVKKEIKYIKKQKLELAKEFALKYKLTLVLKGYRTIVTSAGRFFENKTGNPGMATAGSGDVLTGIIAGLIVQGIESFEAAKLGVYLHGLAGDLVAKDKTQAGLIASDIIEYLSKAIKRILT